MSNRFLHNQTGTTILESMVAVVLFMFAAASVGTMLTQEIRFEGTNGTTTTAIAMAEAELEDIRSLDYVNMASRSPTPTVTGKVTYTLVTTVITDSPAVGMKSINTVVTWTEPNGSQSYAVNAIYTALTR